MKRTVLGFQFGKERIHNLAHGLRRLFGLSSEWRPPRISLSLFAAVACLPGWGPVPARAQTLLDYVQFQAYAPGTGFLGNDFSNPLPSCISGKEIALPASHAETQV